MAQIWTTPKSWTMQEILDSAKLNVHLRDNLDYLFQRPMAYNRFVATGSWANSSAGVIQEIPNTRITVPTETGRIRIDFQYSIGDIRVDGYYDIFNVTEGYWLSSRTATPAARGLYNAHSANNAYRFGVSMFGLDYDLTTGASYEYYVAVNNTLLSEVYDTGSILLTFGKEF